MSHTLSLNWGGDYQEHYLPSPYKAVPIAPSTKNPNAKPTRWLVIHKETLVEACNHVTEDAARMCARGERCTKGRAHTKHRDPS